jgi:hypothetical protein
MEGAGGVHRLMAHLECKRAPRIVGPWFKMDIEIIAEKIGRVLRYGSPGRRRVAYSLGRSWCSGLRDSVAGKKSKEGASPSPPAQVFSGQPLTSQRKGSYVRVEREPSLNLQPQA